jgi:PilZ domain
MEERRRGIRTPVVWHVRLWSDDGMMPAMADDVSDHGIRIVTARRADVQLGRSYRVDVLAGTAAEQSLVAEVRYTDERGRIGLATRSPWLPPVPRPGNESA